MLFDPIRHAPLLPVTWDEQRVHEVIVRIVDDSNATFEPETLWPKHPLDFESDTESPPLTPLYFGATGTVWALQYLEASGIASSHIKWGEHLDSIRVRNRTWLDTTGYGTADASFLMGELPILMLQYAHTPTAALETRLAKLINDNIDHPARELMWGSPGTLLAACFLYECTGNERWAALFRDTAACLWDQLEWSDEHNCHYWTQDLYGKHVNYLDGVHGFVATASPLIRGRHLLDTADWSRWQETIVNTVHRTATWEHGRVNWRARLSSVVTPESCLLMQFCHGAPGFVVCLANLPDKALDDLLIAAGETVWDAGPVAKGASLCHGTAGNGYTFLALYQRTRNPRWLERARAFAMHSIHQIEAHAVQYGQLRYSLWTGDLGVAVYLLDCLRGVAVFPTLDVFYPHPLGVSRHRSER
ncbi:LanC-like protein [Paraburkholderia sp. J12]|uniref:lanthionine synthetase C family protein n=1 Tax=Paraburkholderia sp. J12 TaxID=2805432 RepID=UPI002ABDD829|nr:LanC-like protein [Paraburkholderia sp. J12]